MRSADAARSARQFTAECNPWNQLHPFPVPALIPPGGKFRSVAGATKRSVSLQRFAGARRPISETLRATPAKTGGRPSVRRLDELHRITIAYISAMAPRRITTFRIDEELLDGLRVIEERDGVPVPEQVRRSIRAWLVERGLKLKAAPRRALTHRKGLTRRPD